MATALSKSDFEREVAALLRLREHVAATLRPAVDAILKFANAYRTLHQRIGPNYNRRVELRRRLGLDEYQHQRMMAIAAQSKTLGQFSRALPPAVEPLYEIARLTKDAAGEKRLHDAVKRHELTPTSGVREVRTIRQSTQRRSSKRRTSKAAGERAPSLEFVIEADAVPTWDVVEQFKAELAALVAKFNLRLGAGGGLKNEAAIKHAIEQHREKPKAANDNTPSESELAALHAERDKLNAQYAARVERRSEQAVRRLIDRKWKAKFGKALRSTKGKPFASKKARWAKATKRTGLYRDEVTGGTFDTSAAWVNSEPELAKIIENAGRAGTVQVGSDGAPIAPMLLQAVELGSDSGDLFKVIKAARDSVRVPKRLEQIAKRLEAADAAWQQDHAAELAADDAKLRDMMSRSPSNRVRRSLANWGKDTATSAEAATGEDES